jgi:hypothetical protein
MGLEPTTSPTRRSALPRRIRQVRFGRFGWGLEFGKMEFGFCLNFGGLEFGLGFQLVDLMGLEPTTS